MGFSSTERRDLRNDIAETIAVVGPNPAGATTVSDRRGYQSGNVGNVGPHKRSRATFVPDGVGVRCESADGKPRLYGACQLTRSLDLQQSGAAGVPQPDLAQVHPGDGFEIGSNHQVVTEAWVAVAKVRIVTLQHQPVALFLIPKLEPDNAAPRRQLFGTKMFQDPPHQEIAVKVLGLNLEPLLAPYPEASHQLGEVASCFGEVVGRTPSGDVRTGLYDPHALEAA